VSLLNSVSGHNSSRTDLQFSISNWLKLQKSRIPFQTTTLSAFRWSINGSKWLAICELRQSETRSVAESAFLADHTFLYKTGFWRNFTMTSSETSYMKNVANELRFLLVTHTTCFDIRFGRYGALKFCFSSGQAMDSWTAGIWSAFWTTR
jgi:hypothetical protein